MRSLMEPQSRESSIIKQFCSVFYEKEALRICLNKKMELEKNIIEKGKKWLKLKKLIFYLTGTNLERIVKTVLDDINLYLPDTSQTYTPLTWAMNWAEYRALKFQPLPQLCASHQILITNILKLEWLFLVTSKPKKSWTLFKKGH